MDSIRFPLPQQNGFSIEDGPSTSSSYSPHSLLNPHPFSIPRKYWHRAEKAIKHILCRILPTEHSEHTRRAIANHVQRLINGPLVIQVLPFGSVPLKTYLPDGDIDLTALSRQNVGDVANNVLAVLEREQQNPAAVLEVQDIQYISAAEVKLVKCIVQSLVIDISFNQYGGLSTLCFLEQADFVVGHDHLFKRSTVLIKAWCYYESHILGAHHGLISTYALETMVLYIFQFFGASLTGPLEVLYRFLDYFSKFDWDKYCISLNGPVCLSSLPQIVVEKPGNDEGGPLLNKGLRRFVESVQRMAPDICQEAFTKKHLNIMDPLRANNNLGRSVNQANFYRIRSAFSYGARELGQILLFPKDYGHELIKFFKNTMVRNGNGQRLDVQVHVPTFGSNWFGPASTSPFGFPSRSDESSFLRRGLAFYPSTYPGVAFNGQKMSKPRGIGTFFANKKNDFCNEKRVLVTIRSPEPENHDESQGQTYNNDQAIELLERSPEEGSHETLQDSTTSIPSSPEQQETRTDSTENPEMDAGQSYHLKNEDDFPPLSAENMRKGKRR
ncbi:hypothetical protein IFM89_009650 [Coptis chinensis]|uniref:Polymerase nucleotidyl transferase domain-containing protein n=1 Tax=Coptis chinensis TaxID=261450 RepID=A0A835M509_9MAGN|nr:hypothetical protein IFM89_009650 [Coptis chinensis]